MDPLSKAGPAMQTSDGDSGLPKYERLYRSLRGQILAGHLPAGARLPATRTLAAESRVSRNTVIAAYAQLAAEGYIRSVRGSGCFVAELPSPPAGAWRAAERTEPDPPDKNAAGADGRTAGPARYGGLDTALYGEKAFRRCLRSALAGLERQPALRYPDPQGELSLRRALSAYLAVSRGVRAEAGQIHITGGVQHALRWLTELFPPDSYTFAMENPGYPGASGVFRRAGYRMAYLPLDGNGLDTRALAHLNRALLYVTPSHQFPMGAVLPAGRRMELLRWAEDTDSCIIEDDYDSELRCGEKPVPALASLGSGRVIYTGTFSKTLSPDLRAAYMALPPGLRLPYGGDCAYFGTSVPLWEQLALAAYMENGSYLRHVHALRKILRRRHEAIAKALARTCPGSVRVLGTGGGIHLVLEMQTACTEDELTGIFAQRGLDALPLSPFWDDPAHAPGNQVLLGCGVLPQGGLEVFVQAVTAAVRTAAERSVPAGR